MPFEFSGSVARVFKEREGYINYFVPTWWALDQWKERKQCIE